MDENLTNNNYQTYIPCEDDYEKFKDFINYIPEMCGGDELEDYLPINEYQCHPFMTSVISKISFYSMVIDKPYLHKINGVISDKIFSFLSTINYFYCDYKHIIENSKYIPQKNDYIFFQKFIDLSMLSYL